MNCKEIIKEWLKEHGYDGLAWPENECGCGLDDIAPCGDVELCCRPAYRDDERDGWFPYKPKLLKEN